MIEITNAISISEKDIQIDFIQASGPGGQNVNKVATQAQLRFDARSASLPPDIYQRLARIAGNRLTEDGILIIEARRYRSQERNRLDALDRLVAMLRKAAVPPKTRRKTRPTLASRQKRLESKRRRSQVKQLRRGVDDD